MRCTYPLVSNKCPCIDKRFCHYSPVVSSSVSVFMTAADQPGVKKELGFHGDVFIG